VIRNVFAGELPRELPGENREKNDLPGENYLNSEVLEVLRTELEVKNRQIDELLNANRELTAALENTTESLKAAQLLHAGTMKQHIADPTGGSINQETTKPRFFSRLFGKK
jgi:hypothetical protein